MNLSRYGLRIGRLYITWYDRWAGMKGGWRRGLGWPEFYLRPVDRSRFDPAILITTQAGAEKIEESWWR
jgi:hypothetical protein